MKINYIEYNLDEKIPARKSLKNKKLVKYFNRETAAGIVCLAELLDGVELEKNIPFYYETGLVEYEDYGLDNIVEACEEDGHFSQKAFVEKGMSSISPLTQFKILLNMPASFISIENNITSDNSIIYSSAAGLLIQGLYAETDSKILLGSGKVYKDGKVASGFALLEKDDLKAFSHYLNSEKEGIDLLKEMAGGNNG